MTFIFGIAAGFLGIVGAVPYIRDTIARKTKPHRFAWMIFLLLSIVSFASQLALGASAQLFFAGWFVVNNLILVTLSLRKDGGYGGITPLNIFCLLLGVIGVILWKTLSSALLALICVLVADGIGAILIVIKSYKQPYSETLVMWALGIAASALNVLAVGRLDPVLLASPVQLLFFNIAIVLAIIIGKQKFAAQVRTTQS